MLKRRHSFAQDAGPVLLRESCSHNVKQRRRTKRLTKTDFLFWATEGARARLRVILPGDARNRRIVCSERVSEIVWSPAATGAFLRDAVDSTAMGLTQLERAERSDVPTNVKPYPEKAPQTEHPSMGEMIPEVYEELRRLAAAYLRGERVGHTLQPTALVHEAYLRLRGDAKFDWQNPRHVVGIFARVMRQTLTNHAVARNRLKRGGADPTALTLEFYDSRKIDLTLLNEALEALEVLDARQAQIVELRFFGGLRSRKLPTCSRFPLRP